MNIERLTILRDALIAHAGDAKNLKFDLRSWVVTRAKYRKTPMKALLGARAGRNYCGTVALRLRTCCDSARAT